MRLTPGTRLGPYEIVGPLGAGGMGEVYRARDTRLGREVAVKVLPEHLIENPEVRSRFEREARTVSSLNHPHICTLHDVGHEGDVEYLVMELVDGETLAQRLERGPLPTAEVLRLGIQIADALDRAHRAGIVHRDFKPGNVMLTRSGAKLMDFGLARATVAANQGGRPISGSGVTIATLTQSPTAASPLTSEGSLVGTFLYMAPEQLEGREVDARSDLWALGCVLYEMATGRRAFEGKSQASLIGAIMHSEPPPIGATAPATPPALEGLVRACLAKDPEERVQTAHDVKLQLSWIGAPGSQSGVVAPAELPKRRASREPLAWAVAGVAVVAAALFAWRAMGPGGGGAGGRGGATAQQIRFTVPVPPAINSMTLPRISPDGSMLAFSAQDSSGMTQVWLRPLNSLSANALPGTAGAGRPFWSPDSRYLAFVADGKLKKVPVAGGPPEVVCDAPDAFDGSWSRGGVILFDGRVGGADGLRQVNASGGVATPVMPPDTSVSVGWPTFLPDGKHYFYLKGHNDGTNRIMVAKLGEGKGRPLEISGSRVEYSPDGYVLFVRERTLLAQRFDSGSLKVEGDPFPIAEDVPASSFGLANFSLSDNGILVYRSVNVTLSRLVWLDRTGREIGEVAPAADYRAPALSPDGTRIALRRRDPGSGNLDLWVMEPGRGTTTRFTFDPGDDGNPVWSPDGSRILWTSFRGGQNGLFVKSASGLGQDEFVARTGPNSAALDWSADGSSVLFMDTDPRTGVDLYSVSMTGPHTPQVILKTDFNEQRAAFSPDGKWIAYQSDEAGRNEIYVSSFGGAAGKWQVSTSGGTDPCWSWDGRELFYLTTDQRLMSVAISPGATFSPSTPQVLFPVRVEAGRRRNVFCPSPDGKRFLFLVSVGETSTPMTVVVNWRGGGAKK
jgi:Tol biopolymer transport system component